jgi:hypothetical protein
LHKEDPAPAMLLEGDGIGSGKSCIKVFHLNN